MSIFASLAKVFLGWRMPALPFIAIQQDITVALQARKKNTKKCVWIACARTFAASTHAGTRTGIHARTMHMLTIRLNSDSDSLLTHMMIQTPHRCQAQRVTRGPMVLACVACVANVLLLWGCIAWLGFVGALPPMPHETTRR